VDRNLNLVKILSVRCANRLTACVSSDRVNTLRTGDADLKMEIVYLPGRP